MHDNLIEAVQWAIAEGIADPKRIAVYGGSYGGHAALCGTAFTQMSSPAWLILWE